MNDQTGCLVINVTTWNLILSKWAKEAKEIGLKWCRKYWGVDVPATVQILTHLRIRGSWQNTTQRVYSSIQHLAFYSLNSC